MSAAGVTRPPRPRAGSRLAAGLLGLVGLGLVVTPFVLHMWTRAPRGAKMIGYFRPIMTAHNVTLLTNHYMPTLALGFGTVPQALTDAARHFGHATLTYPQAAGYLARHPGLTALSYLQRNFAAMAVPFTNMLTVMNHTLADYQGMAGLPSFTLFPLFFVLPGVIFLACAVLLARRTSRRAAARGGRALGVALVVGALLALASFLPMPPGFGLMWNVAPGGARMLADFSAPLAPGSPPVMSAATVTLFDGYLATMHRADSEILPAISDVAASEHVHLGASGAAAFLRSQPDLAEVVALRSGFPAMYANFERLLTNMRAALPDYAAVQALPSFRLFPYFFILPGLLAVLAGLGWAASNGTPTPDGARGSDPAPAAAARAAV